MANQDTPRHPSRNPTPKPTARCSQTIARGTTMWRSTPVPGVTVRGRAVAETPTNRFETTSVELTDEEHARRADEHPDGRRLETNALAEQTRRIINRVDAEDMPFRWTVNPYRGCEHGCVYCYARPTHEYLGLNCGLDFDTKIVAKDDAPRLLRRELSDPAWRGEPIVFSGVTDAWQPLERTKRITRRCVEIIAACRQPISIVTKNRLVTRDLDLLQELAAHNAVHVALSVTTLDASLAARMEPRASRPADRLRAIRELRDAGVPVSAMIAPVIPGLTDVEIPQLIDAVRDAGAQAVGRVMLRLPWQVKTLFLEWIRREAPHAAHRVEQRIRDVRGGALYDSTPGARLRGEGEYADHLNRTFDMFARRAGLAVALPPLSSAAFRRGPATGQMELWG